MNTARQLLDALHEPLLPLLATLLADLADEAELPRRVLDLGCGAGGKLALLRARWPKAVYIGLDLERALILASGEADYTALLVGDAHGLPLADACLDLVWCCATIGLLARPQLALREMGRVLRPGGRLLLVTATRQWALPISWPARVREALAAARCAPWDATICDQEVGRELGTLLIRAGLDAGVTRAWPLDGEQAGDELALLDWEGFQAAAGQRLDDALRARCAQQAAASEPAMVSLVVATLATKT